MADWTGKYKLPRDIVHRPDHRGVPDPNSIPGLSPSHGRNPARLPSAKANKLRNWQSQYITPTDNVGVGKTNHVRPPSKLGPRGVGDARPKTMRSLIGLQENQHALTKILARYVPAGTGGVTGSQTLSPLVYSPSSRLRVSINVVFEPDNLSAGDAAFNLQPTWDIQSVMHNPETARLTALQQAYPVTGSANLPDGYEFDSAVRTLRPDVVLQDTNFAAAYVPTTEAASCVLICTWEPNVEIPHDELEKLFAACQISFGQPLIIENNAV